MKDYDNNHTYKKIRLLYNLFLKKHNLRFFIYLLVKILDSVCSIISPVFMGGIIDLAIAGKVNAIIKYIIILIVLLTISGLLSLIESFLRIRTISLITSDVKSRLLNKILLLKLNQIEDQGSGEYISRIEEAEVIGGYYMNLLETILINTFTLIFTLVIMIKLSVNMSLISFISVPIMLSAYCIFSKYIKRKELLIKKHTDKYFSFLSEILKGIKEIKGLRAEHIISEKYDKIKDSLIRQQIGSSRIGIISGYFNLMLNGLFYIIIIGMGCFNIINNNISVGAFFSFSTYLNRYSNLLSAFTTIGLDFQKVLITSNRVVEILNLDDEAASGDNGKLLNSPVDDIRINNVYFSYDEERGDVIRGMNAVFERNSITAIVGENGTGKSTLFDLIMRFYDVDSGDIEINSIKTKLMDIAYLRSIISYAGQKSYFFDTSIHENLKLSNPAVTDEKIKEVCNMVGINDFIERLPMEYNTIMGDNGVKMSGGQLQRLAVARSLLQESEVILFDEITSDLDGINENGIVDLLRKISENHIVIIIAHRLSTIINLPRILIMNQGIIEHEGTHLSLLKNSLTYKKLYDEEWTAYKTIINDAIN